MTSPPPPSETTVYVYLSTDAGATWRLVRTVLDTQGFAFNDNPEIYQYLVAPPGDPTSVAMLGMAGFNGTESTQQFVWMSDDAALSWFQNPNWADPYIDGQWQVFSPGGITAFPGTRPIVTGSVYTPQGSIVG